MSDISGKKIKVVQFIGSIQDGGAETLVKDYMQFLDKDSFDVVAVVLRISPNTANDKIIQESGIRVISICKSNNVIMKIIQCSNYWWYVPYRLKRILKEEEPNVLHVHLQLLHYVEPIIDNFKSIRLFYTVHSKATIFFNNHKEEYKAAKKLLEKKRLNLISLQEDMKQDIDSLFNIQDTLIIRNGIMIKKYRNNVEKVEERKILGIPDNAFVLCNIGRFVKIKNHDFLLSIFEKAMERNKECFLLLIGSGKLKEEIEHRLHNDCLEKRYTILSHRSDIPEILKAADVFVFPSINEGLGISAIEAQACGLRCVISDGVPEDAVRTDTCIRLKLSDGVDAWCDAIFDESRRSNPVGSLDDYDLEKEIKRLEELYLGDE